TGCAAARPPRSPWRRPPRPVSAAYPPCASCTRRPPASQRARPRLALGVLRALARLVTPVLLALDLARVARDEAGLLEPRAQPGVRERERARDAVRHGHRLRGDAAAEDVHLRMVLAHRRRHLERLVDHHAGGLARKVVFEGAPVDDDVARPR